MVSGTPSCPVFCPAIDNRQCGLVPWPLHGKRAPHWFSLGFPSFNSTIAGSCGPVHLLYTASPSLSSNPRLQVFCVALGVSSSALWQKTIPTETSIAAQELAIIYRHKAAQIHAEKSNIPPQEATQPVVGGGGGGEKEGARREGERRERDILLKDLLIYKINW